MQLFFGVTRETQGKVTEKPRDGVRVAALSEMQSRGGQLSSQWELYTLMTHPNSADQSKYHKGPSSLYILCMG